MFCFLTSKAFKKHFTLKAPEATRSASIKERQHFRIRNQERKLSPANTLNEPSQTSHSRPQRPEIISFPCLFTHPIELEESSRARSRLFRTLPETNPPSATPPRQPRPGRGCSLNSSQTRPPARRKRGYQCPGRR